MWRSQPIDEVESSGTIGKSRRRARHTIHIRLQCPEDSILKANLVKIVKRKI